MIDRKTSASPAAEIELDTYVPALLTWISNKLSGGASTLYLKHFGVGIEVWRCLVLLAKGAPISAQYISQTIGLDKASVSRCFKKMHADKLIAFSDDAYDKRVRLATITRKGRDLHDQIIGLALVREEALLSTLSERETDTLIKILHKLHSNLPAVEAASEAYLGETKDN
ncbi:MarR family transcriptional regulator [Aestuariicella hydrocarbonica]|uniref:MarR family transcriptional regulator n=1 Tax=Pseudomaricurvus hydrocarbonicus TaxID=1470433 RepID=A0A9E5MNB3_9GAMM|nr:MarR family transcriptional regulator [Aestuariicella hydrocarbonica]NHO67347.1 MarR family transcriptional regulator [Aestuariicella hydrocarbonica]